MKTRLISIFFAALALCGMALFNGCSGTTEEDSELPWAQPAPYEGQVPGMPGPGQY